MQDAIKILKSALLSAVDPITEKPIYDDREVRSIVDLVLEEVCGFSRLDRVLHPDLHLTASQHEVLVHCAQKLSQGIPVQQALGYEWFCGQKFHISSDVLIPRPETAELIDWIQSSIPQDNRVVRILDMGTGSGCIAITLARLINNSKVYAVDLSTAALSIASTNAYEQSVDNVQFAQCDILKCEDEEYVKHVINHFSTTYQPSEEKGEEQFLSTSCQQEKSSNELRNESCQQTIESRFDIIVSNPPYICRREAKEMSSLVLFHEPEMALFVPDDDPLLFYRTIARFARQHLSPGGNLFFEINAAYGAETCQMLRDEGFSSVELRKDVNGRDRMVKALLKGF